MATKKHKTESKDSMTDQVRLKTVLIVEDEPMLQDAYKHVLSFRGYTVYTADNGEEGLGQLEAHRPDIVLLDVLMPKLDGIGFLRRAEVVKNYPDTKVVVCSNLSDQATADTLRDLGAHRQVLKSDLSPSELIELVSSL